MNNVCWLSELTRDDVAVAGGKGANLGELIRAGFDVPAGFVVTTACYDAFVASAGLDAVIGATATEIGEAFRAREIPAGLAEEIASGYARLGQDLPVAIRSSATAEDLAEASFAGQQDTYLNVIGREQVLAAVRDCWASLWTERAIRYRAEHGVDSGALSLAVVVQRLVPAAAAGVMFTANPANGRVEETVITAAWGLGEAVVSGQVEPDSTVVDTTSGRILSCEVADKALRIDPAAAGVHTSATSASERGRAVLDQADALRLAGIGSAIEKHFGAPQDIEWALVDQDFVILQSRPITALPPRTGPVPTQWPVPAKGLYFRASIIEQLPDPLTPLFADLAATAVPEGLNRFLSEMMPGGESADLGFPTINGYAFYRYSYAAFGAMLKLSPAAMRLLLADGGEPFVRRWRERLAEYEEAVAVLGGAEPSTLASAELLGRLGRLVDEMSYYYTSVQTIIPLAATAELSWIGLYDKLLKRRGDPSADTFLLGLDSEPIRAEKALFDLAGWVREQPGLAEALAGNDPLADAAPSWLDQSVWRQWRDRFAAHLAAHGHALYNLDFVNPVAADEPGPLLQALRHDLGPDATDPHARQRRAADDRERATAELLARLPGWQRGSAGKVVARAQRLGPLREDALAAMGRYLPSARRLLRELGTRLVAAGALVEPMDVCWLTLVEAKAAAASLDAGGAPEPLMARVEDRRTVARGQRLATPPQYLPKNAAMDAFGWMYPAKEGEPAGGVLTGTGGSGGVVTATARVLTGPQDFADFRPGEIVVASITTPAYTPLFAMAAGVVTDIGGVLSHGSIVAREYGIPAVLGTGSATRAIHTGDQITVDGSRGVVLLPGGVEPVPDQSDARRRWLVAGGVAAVTAATAAHFWYRGRRR